MNHITEDRNGTKWIKNKRLKTSVEFMVPILPIPQLIIDKYSNHPGRQTQGKVIPTISDQNYNGYLKEVAIRAKISKNLTSHIARHTFATTITLEAGCLWKSFPRCWGIPTPRLLRFMRMRRQ